VLRPLAAVAVLLGATAPAALAAPREVTVGVSGDLLPHLPVVARAVAYGDGRPDFRPMLRRIRPWVRRNDLAHDSCARQQGRIGSAALREDPALVCLQGGAVVEGRRRALPGHVLLEPQIRELEQVRGRGDDELAKVGRAAAGKRSVIMGLLTPGTPFLPDVDGSPS